MEKYTLGKFDVVVIGAGHAGCEAALACARMGKETLLLSINLEAVANMFCNPAVGGTGKGHLVREIDALGGEMGLNIDKTFIQSRMLNVSKGPAVHSLRAQADKRRYHEEMKKVLESQEHLLLKQGEAVDINFAGDGSVRGVLLRTGAYYECRAAIIATGTFLGGKIFIGESVVESGPNGLSPSTILAEALKNKGFKMRRFKTGTPARCLASSLDFSKMQVQEGDPHPVPFSFMNDNIDKEQAKCWLTYTNEETHKIIRANFGRSALFGGQIEGVGPRYCPSIESKLDRFPDKERHQLFVEPEGLSTQEMYLQGMSTSLPEDVQQQFYETIPGLENIRLMRAAYAIEYDCIDPMELKLSLEHRQHPGFFCAGQFNGSSGYEEAAAQGLMAGINAALYLDGRDPFVLDRSEAYIGVLIDDLVTKGTNEPYRMMTSRAEYRLILRQDNADLRLTEKGRSIGLVSDERWERFLADKKAMEEEVQRFENTTVAPSEANPLIESLGGTPVDNRVSLSELLRRPEITYDALAAVDPERPALSYHVRTKVEVSLKYRGYIEKQLAQIEKFKKLEGQTIPEDIDYMAMEGLRNEAREKLTDIRPVSVGQASRISGVSPADINVLLVQLERMRRKH
ncbi:MAG: tRNA uridine-5-carboxymethylaminomethyl(34) synthesis enzyme MnmG [Clostridia bacterium]|nr:tRNA uridine-5-carboxymethylaminomethyl(34) synthesis enzyme MnmG [Clostridia bacterium]